MTLAWRTLAVAAVVALAPLIFRDDWGSGVAIMIGTMAGSLVGDMLLPLLALARGERKRGRRIYRLADADDETAGYAWAPATSPSPR